MGFSIDIPRPRPYNTHLIMGDEAIRVEATVKETLPNAMYRVQLKNGHIVLAYVSGRMRMRYNERTRILPGDRVIVEMSPYDLTRGRIIKRERT